VLGAAGPELLPLHVDDDVVVLDADEPLQVLVKLSAKSRIRQNNILFTYTSIHTYCAIMYVHTVSLIDEKGTPYKLQQKMRYRFRLGYFYVDASI
jgi:hypothetical protein